VSKYQRKLTRLLARFIRDPVEVEDVAQEAFIKAYRALPSFRGDSAFYTCCTASASIPPRTISCVGPARPDDDRVQFRGAEVSRMRAIARYQYAESMIMSKEIAQTVNDTMERLPEELRNAITLRELEGLSYEESRRS